MRGAAASGRSAARLPVPAERRPDTRSPASTRCSRACSSARRILGPRHPATRRRRRRRRAVRRRGGADRPRARLPGAGRAGRRGSLDRTPGLPTCADGVCRAQDLAVWTEVQSAGGDWIPVDATPQYAQSPSLDVTEQRDPENITEVRPDAAEDVVPPTRSRTTPAGETPTTQQASTSRWLWPILRVVGLALLVAALVLRPFLVVVGGQGRAAPARAARTATRRSGSPAAGTSTSMPRSTPAATSRPRSRAASGRGPRDGLRRRAGRRRRPGGVLGLERHGRRTQRASGSSSTGAPAVLARRRGVAQARRDRIVEIIHPSRGTCPGVPAALRREGKRRAAEPVRLTP